MDLCRILGISINEFLAGEDIDRDSIDSIVQKSEENLIEVAVDSKQKQKRSKIVIYTLLVVVFVAISVIVAQWYLANKPQNYITPIDRDSIEQKIAELLSGTDGAFLYQFTTTDTYQSLSVYYSEYQTGTLVKKENLGVRYAGKEDQESLDQGSPDKGMILIIPEFEHFAVKLIIADESSKLSTEIPILEGVPEREYYMRSATEVLGATDIRYGEEQPLLALIYDNDQMYVFNIEDIADGRLDSFAEDDYVYYFSYKFSKES